MVIEDIKIDVDEARLFNQEHIEWGVMHIRDKVNNDANHEYLFLISDIELEFAELSLS